MSLSVAEHCLPGSPSSPSPPGVLSGPSFPHVVTLTPFLVPSWSGKSARLPSIALPEEMDMISEVSKDFIANHSW